MVLSNNVSLYTIIKLSMIICLSILAWLYFDLYHVQVILSSSICISNVLLVADYESIYQQLVSILLVIIVNASSGYSLCNFMSESIIWLLGWYHSIVDITQNRMRIIKKITKFSKTDIVYVTDPVSKKKPQKHKNNRELKTGNGNNTETKLSKQELCTKMLENNLKSSFSP